MIAQRSFAVVAIAGALLVGACAQSAQPGGVDPADVSALEAQRERHPSDISLLTQLGIAYYNAKNYDRARDVLLATLALNKANYSALVYLGLTYEELNQFSDARASYTSAAALTTSTKQKAEISDHLALLTKKELQEAARQAIAQEAELAQEPPVENTVAVFPFRYVGTNEDLRPLERGLTHLVITDLSRVNRLRLLERERVQSLVDELQLAEAGRVDPATGARSGRLLRAAQVVQGSLQDIPAKDQLKLDASVVNSTTQGIVASGSGTDKLQQLFDMEKRVVLQLLQNLGIALTPAEQRAISERPTADLQAFLAFSRGLEAEDRGDFKAAEGYFGAAVARDPNFRAAGERRTQNAQFSAAAQNPAPQLAGMQVGTGGIGTPVLATSTTTVSTSRASTLGAAVAGTVPSIGSTINTQVATQPPITQPALPQSGGNDDPVPPPPTNLTGNIIIIITRP